MSTELSRHLYGVDTGYPGDIRYNGVEMTSSPRRRHWSYRRWLASQPVSPQVLRLRHALAWTVVLLFWLDWAITALALAFGQDVRELNPLGVALYESLGLLGLAALKAIASLLVLIGSGWVRPMRAVFVLRTIFALYGFILLWNSLQLAFFV